MKPEVYYPVHKTLPVDHILIQMNLVHTLISHFINIHFNIIPKFKHRFFFTFPTNIFYKFLIVFARAAYPAQLIYLILITLVIFGEGYKL
jgi:hypothetical protein